MAPGHWGYRVCNKIVNYANYTTNCIILYKYVATCFDQLRGHPQATRAHQTKITTENFLLSQNEICHRVHLDTI